MASPMARVRSGARPSPPSTRMQLRAFTNRKRRMPFFDELMTATAAERAALLATPLLQRAVHGDITRADYLAFLGEAYHHVRHTAPLLAACGARLPAHLHWLRAAVDEYIAEETGHEEWILADIPACDGDAGDTTMFGTAGPGLSLSHLARRARSDAHPFLRVVDESHRRRRGPRRRHPLRAHVLSAVRCHLHPSFRSPRYTG